MEITGTEFSRICGFKSAHNIYMQFNKGKLTRTQNKTYNIFEPLNQDFLVKHGKSRIDVETFLKEKEKNKSSHCRPNTQKNQPEQQKINDQSDILFKSVNIIITRKYSADEAREVKNLIFQEMGKYV